MVAGGISKYGLSNLVFCSGTQNNFSYKQFLIFLKDDMDKIKKIIIKTMIYYSNKIMLVAIKVENQWKL